MGREGAWYWAHSLTPVSCDWSAGPRADLWLVQVPAWVWGAVAGEQQPDGGTTQNYACFSYAADYLVIDTNTANDAVNPLCQRD